MTVKVCNRADVWLFLARCFTYPTREFVEFLLKNRETFLSMNASMFFEWLSEYQESIELLGVLEEEYTRLFITSFPHMVVSPFETSYRETEELSRELIEIIGQYERADFFYDERSDLRADHIAVELEFLGLACQTGHEQNSQDFFNEHGLLWFPKFARAVREKSTVPLYQFCGTMLLFSMEASD